MVDFAYFSTLSNIPKYFERIRQAKTPEDKFSTDFLKNTLNFSSGNDAKLIGVLRAMKFLDESNHPLQLYRDFRSETTAPYETIGKGMKNAYHSLYARDENLHERNDDEIRGHVMAVTGEKEGAPTVRLITQSFIALAKLAKFQNQSDSTLSDEEKQNLPIHVTDQNKGFHLTHTIILNLPTTTTQEVYDAIFKSLRENLSQ